MNLEVEPGVDSIGPMGSAPTDTMALPSPRPGTRLLSSLGLVALAVSALVGGNAFDLREQLMGSVTPAARPAAVSRGGEGPAATPAPAEPAETVLSSQPWWQGIATLEGEGSASTDAFTVVDGAIQWRVTATCTDGALSVGSPAGDDPLIEGPCGATEVGYGTDPGTTSLQVEASGAWQLQVEQQIDVPLVEAPTPAMTAAETVVAATGDFYRIDQAETGAVTVYRLADGTHALRLDDFYVTPNVDLEIHLSPLEAPQTTEEFMAAPSVEVAPLDVTAGSMNFAVPAEVDPSQYRSVVIWCPLINSAYAGASLVPNA